MAKLSSVNKNERRKLVKKYAGRYAEIEEAIAADTSLDDGERLIAPQDGEIPRNSNPTRIRNRCELTEPVRALIIANSGCAVFSSAIWPTRA